MGQNPEPPKVGSIVVLDGQKVKVTGWIVYEDEIVAVFGEKE